MENNIYTPEDIAIENMVNNHAAECRRARNADARLTRFWALLTWSLYLGAFLVLICGAWIAIKSALVAPIVGKVVIGLLIAMCIRCLYKLIVVFGGEAR